MNSLWHVVISLLLTKILYMNSLWRVVISLSLNLHNSFIFEQLTNFGLSKVGLISNKNHFYGLPMSGKFLLGDKEDRFVVGTPDYLAPEILLGTGHVLLTTCYNTNSQ